MSFVIPQLKPGSCFHSKPVTDHPCHVRFSVLRARKSRMSNAEIERAIGITPDPFKKSSSDRNSSMMDFLESTPIGKESDVEKAIREVAEKVTDQAEANTAGGFRFVLNVCMTILPVWLMALAIASGAIKLPFDIPFLDDLTM
ncbi:hypothetical protein LUZ60_013670 [Juncus effusus]|nr:hypothetical protein LUZ60_013670 [Juncus effusus]